MQRVFFYFLIVLVLLGVFSSDLLAQGWPEHAATKGTHEIERGPGFYFALWKIGLIFITVLIWARSTAWVAADVEEFGPSIGQKPEVWNAVTIFSFLIGLICIGLSIPIFAAGFPLILISWAAPVFTYLAIRDKKAPEDRKVLTLAGIQRTLLSLVQSKSSAGRPAAQALQPWELGPAIDLTALGPMQNQNQAAMIEARQNPAYVSLKRLFADAFARRADRIRLDYTADAVAVRYMIDGLWHAAEPKVHDKEPLDRALGDAMLFVLKRISHLNPQDRRSQQKGKFQAAYEGKKTTVELQSQGTQTGEAVMVTFVPILKTARTVEELGMREKMRQQVKEILDRPESLLVICSMPGDGLTATWLGVLKMADRLLRDFVTVENANNGEPGELVENLDINKYDPAKGEKALEVIYRLKLRQPDVYLAPLVENGDVLQALCDQIEDEQKSVVLSTRAKEAADALVRLLAMKPDDPEKFISRVTAVLNQRLIRRLCETCKEAVPLSPELAQRLRIPPGRVQNLYREKQPLPPDQPPPKGVPLICPNCGGLGYKGRIAIYELLIVTDQLREVLRKKPQVDLLRQYAAKGGHPSLQEEGILLVAAGVTSLSELQRVLKQ